MKNNNLLTNHLLNSKIFHLLIIITLLLPVTITAQDNQVNLEETVNKFKNELDLTSISVALVKDKEIVWKNAFGKANIEEDINFTTKHLFCLGSVSKLFTGTALLKLYEEGKLSLDDDVNKYLSFPVRNPKYPDTPITFRMLLTHTSSVGDYQEMQNRLYSESNGDSEMSLSEVTVKFFDPKGEFYRKNNFLEFEPGTEWEYSNWNFVLIGYVVELLSGKPYNEYSREILLNPLEMNSSGWFIKNVDKNNISTMYRKNESGKIFKLNPLYGWPGYCDGMLRSNVEDASNFLMMIINKGSFNGKQILKPETIAEMLKPQKVKNLPSYFSFKDMGLVWFIPSEPDNIFAHSGSPSGSVATMIFNPQSNTGIVSYITGFDNRSSELISRIDEFLNYLLDQADDI